MKAVSILLFVLFLSTGVQAKSIQCEGIALSTGVQCKKKIALKHNTTLCYHHKYTNYLEAQEINFNHSKQTSTTSAYETPVKYESFDDLFLAKFIFTLIFVVGNLYTHVSSIPAGISPETSLPYYK